MSSKEVCPVCVIKTQQDDKSIQCDGMCDRWFHATCMKISTTEFSRLASNEGLKWNCGRDDCINVNNQPQTLVLTQLSALTKQISKLTEQIGALASLPAKIDKVIEEVDKLNQSIVRLDERVSSNEDRIKIIEKKLEADVLSDNFAPEDTIAEINERKRRASNIMIYNLVESTNSNTEIKVKHDFDLVTKLLTPCLSNFSQDGIKVYRVGKKQPNKARPLKIILRSELDVRKILSNFSPETATETDPYFESVKLARDKTPRELAHIKKMKAELEDRKSRGERNITIRYRNNIPAIVKLTKNA